MPDGPSSQSYCSLLNQEVDLLLSPSIPTLVLPALPFIFLSKDLQAISPSVLQDRPFPINLQFSKVFSSEHIRAIETEFESARRLGPATAEEWLKGLADRGKNRRNDAARWDKWALSGGFSAMLPVEENFTSQPTNFRSAHGDLRGEWHEASNHPSPQNPWADLCTIL